MRTRKAVLWLLKESKEWRRFFRDCCETSPFRLRAQVWQFREELAERDHDYPDKGNPELEDALFGLARELLPDSAAARWDADWADGLCRDALARLAEHHAELSAEEKDALDLSSQDVWHERIVDAALENDPAAFRAALEGWEPASLEALKRATPKGGAA